MKERVTNFSSWVTSSQHGWWKILLKMAKKGDFDTITMGMFFELQALSFSIFKMRASAMVSTS